MASDLTRIRDPARFSGPSTPRVLVERDRLDQTYALATGRVLSVVAPAGYGKSTIIARWIRSDDREIRWLDLERLDNDPLVLAATLDRALSGLAGVDAPERLGGSAMSGRALADRLARARPFVLVLDDVHLVDEPAAMGLIERVAAALPPTSTLVLAGRALHAAALPRLRLDPGVIELTASDLAFDEDETRQMTSALGLATDDIDVGSLHRRFEGWPAGLRLAAIAATSRPTPSESSVDELVRSPYVREYLAAEWLSRLNVDDRELLAGAACLGRFTAEMCDRVLDRTGSLADLGRLTRAEAMVVPLDRSDEWFRMHDVLSESLETDLRSRAPRRWHEIHAAAARWWDAAGDVDLAIEHARIVGDMDMCAELVVAAGPRYMARGMYTTVLRWFDALGDERLADSPELCVLAAITAVQDGDGSRAERLVGMIPPPTDDDHGTLSVRVGAARAVVDDLEPFEVEQLVVPHLDELPRGAWRACAEWAAGCSRFIMGDGRGENHLRSALTEAQTGELWVLEPNIMSTIAITRALADDTRTATELSRRARRLISRHRPDTVASTAVTAAAGALVEARSGRRDVARELLAHANELYRGISEVSPWHNIVGRLAMAHACIAIDEPASAREHISTLRGLRDGARALPVDEWIDDLDASVRRMASATGETRWQLTEAERRVVQYLPTNLSLGDIAARLYVSRNTVKSHVAAIYRKLGATSRNDAVEAAREAGIIEREGPTR